MNETATDTLTWDDINNEFLIEHDDQITRGELRGKQQLVFLRWLKKNFQVPARTQTTNEPVETEGGEL